jgi:hypothetical protein
MRTCAHDCAHYAHVDGRSAVVAIRWLGNPADCDYPEVVCRLPPRGVMGSFPGDARVRSAHGVAAVRRVTRASNDIAVHLLEFDVMPGPSWSDLSSDSLASLSIVLEAIGGRVETRRKRAEPSPDGPFTMSFTPPGTPI